jgi:hypothetical protein
MTCRDLLLLCVLASSCATTTTPLRGLYQETLDTPWQQAQYVATTREGCEPGLEVLAARAAALKLPITLAEMDRNTVGRFYHEERRIEINALLGSCSRLEVLAHELGHALAPPQLAGSQDGQVFADGVSYLAVQQLGGYSPRAVYATYLAGRKFSVPTLLIYERDIERAADWLVHGGAR